MENTYSSKIGTMKDVFEGRSERTMGGLRKKDLIMDNGVIRRNRIHSIKKLAEKHPEAVLALATKYPKLDFPQEEISKLMYHLKNLKIE